MKRHTALQVLSCPGGLYSFNFTHAVKTHSQIS